VAGHSSATFLTESNKMKKFLVNIWAYDYHAKFEVLCEDNPISLEKSILDKLGEKSIKWESAGMFSDKLQRITYEEVINDAATSTVSLQSEKEPGSRMGAGAS
tara:strand:+ start:20 stop:328 length:309 start_codon:yes stop_codon:yes gene_type:complete